MEFPREMPAINQTIAVVDDDARFNRAIQRLLQASGFETNAFDSAEDFLANHAPESHGCLILDIHLPGMSGFELFDRLSEYDPHLPVIFITAEDREPIRDRAYRISGNTCLQKPVAGVVLLEAVRSRLGRRDSNPE
jgi:two-component system, LuxR family, response regulator FixJ